MYISRNRKYDRSINRSNICFFLESLTIQNNIHIIIIYYSLHRSKLSWIKIQIRITCAKTSLEKGKLIEKRIETYGWSIEAKRGEGCTHFFASIFKIFETFLDFHPLAEIVSSKDARLPRSASISVSLPLVSPLSSSCFFLQPSISHSIRQSRNGRYAAPSLQILYHFYEA